MHVHAQRRSCRIVIAIAVVLALCTPQAPSQSPSDPAPDAAVERWRALSPEERERLLDRYERYRALSAEERVELVERARHLRAASVRVQRELSKAQHDRLERLPAEQRREVVRDLVEGEARDIAQRIRGKLPEQWLAELEKATPEERARFLVEFKQRQQGRMTKIALQALGEKQGLPQAEIDEYKALSQPERESKVLELRERANARGGLPSGLTPNEWDEWKDLPPEDFFRRMTEHLLKLRAARAPADDLRPIDRTPRSEETLRRLEDAIRLRPDEVMDLAELAPDARKDRIFQATRKRALAIIREKRLMSPERIQELVNAPPRIFFAEVLRLLAPLRLADPRSKTEVEPTQRGVKDAEKRPADR